MAIVDTQAVPAHLPTAHGVKPQSSIACVGLLYCATSNRTFRIPDVPATSSVGHIKSWYAKNVADNVDPRALVVISNNLVLEDNVLVWQLAQGQGQFAVTVAENKSPRSVLSLLVDSTLPIPPIPLCLPDDSTVLYVKQKLFEMLNMPMSLASSAHTTLMMLSSSKPLPNSCTLAECGVLNNARLALAFQPETSPTISPTMSPTMSPFQQPVAPVAPVSAPMSGGYGSQPQQYARIKEIWADDAANPNKYQEPTPPTTQKRATAASHALLPSLLLEDEEDEGSVLAEFIAPPAAHVDAQVQAQNQTAGQRGNTTNNNSGHKGRGGRRQRSRSPPGESELTPDQLQHLAANFRTKLCRNGHNCKFGRNCWFAHNPEELRKPSDPLPNNLPAVHKLERYSHREATAAKDRQAS